MPRNPDSEIDLVELWNTEDIILLLVLRPEKKSWMLPLLLF